MRVLVPQAVVVRGIEADQCSAVDAPYSQIVTELRDQLADGAEVACLCCGAKLCSIKEFGSIIIQPDSNMEGHIGAVCKECALAATNDDLIRVFQVELESEGAECPLTR
jgi:hypothetical protein